MSLYLQKIAGQLLILGFRGETADINSEICKEISENQVGGVILFDKDMVHNQPVHNIKSPEQVRKLTEKIQSYSDNPIFISIDQEGGVVNRLKADYGFPSTRSHQVLGNLPLEETEKEAALIAKTLKELGINLNFAPVVDLDVNFENPIIHKKQRSFSPNSSKVIDLAKIYWKEHQKQGVLATLKHFPGHGSSFGDTHLQFTDVTETWTSEELLPYQTLIGDFGFDDMVMTTHIFNAKLDENHPATLSQSVLTGMLRNQLGFKGLIVTDDLQMKGITERYGLEQAVILALNAGADLLCFGNNLAKEPTTSKDITRFLENGLKSGQLSEELLLNKYETIHSFKKEKLRN